MISSLDVIMLEATPVGSWRDGSFFLIPSKVQILNYHGLPFSGL